VIKLIFLIKILVKIWNRGHPRLIIPHNAGGKILKNFLVKIVAKIMPKLIK
jgi:hypothetical protein